MPTFYTLRMSTISELRQVLSTCKTIAVVGLSPQWHRPSYFAAKYMQAHGYRIVPVNPVAKEDILGERCYPTLTAAAADHAIDMVDCFRKSADIPPIADEAIRLGAKCLWLQLGVINPEAAEKAAAAGLDVVMDRCVKIEHARLFGGLNFAGGNTPGISAQRQVHNLAVSAGPPATGRSLAPF